MHVADVEEMSLGRQASRDGEEIERVVRLDRRADVGRRRRGALPLAAANERARATDRRTGHAARSVDPRDVLGGAGDSGLDERTAERRGPARRGVVDGGSRGA